VDLEVPRSSRGGGTILCIDASACTAKYNSSGLCPQHCENDNVSIDTIILPCEVKGRELNSKLLLGGLLVERGFTVIVGSRNAIHMRLPSFKRSVYLGKDVRYSSVEILKILQALGHVFVAHDEESQFYYSRETYLKARVHPDVFRSAHDLMAWGPDNAAAWTEADHYGGNPVHITGNGRMDLLRPELRTIYRADATQHQNTYGRYILLSSNFSSLNHFIPNLTPMQLPPDAPYVATGNWATDMAGHRMRLFKAFLALLPQLARAFPQYRIIARPHPAENHVTWQQAAQGHDNIVVTNAGDILAWLLGADALIHNGCTTGLEAYLLDRHAIAFQPYESQDHDLHLPNDLSTKMTCAANLIDHLRAELLLVDGPRSMRSASRDEKLGQFVLTDPQVLASELIASIIAERAVNPGADSHIMTKIYGKTRSALRAGLKTWNSEKQNHKSSRHYTLHRFPATSATEIEQRLNAIAIALNRFSSVRVEDLAESVFRLS
jgi:surface carbohydrate biosynthesis protein